MLVLRISVAVAFLVMVIINVLQSNSSTVIGNQTNAQISDAFPTFFTPAGFTFSVWAVIYIFSGIYAIYQVLPSQQHNLLLDHLAPFQLVNFLCNSVWSIVFAYEKFWTSVVIIFINVLALAKSYSILHCACDSVNKSLANGEIADSSSSAAASSSSSKATSTAKRSFFVDSNVVERSWKETILVSLCVSTNLSWILLASFLNFTVALQAKTSFVSDSDWAVAWLLVAAIVAGYIAVTFADVAYISVAIWAVIGIISKQKDVNVVRGFGIALVFYLIVVLLVGLIRRRYRLSVHNGEATQPIMSSNNTFTD